MFPRSLTQEVVGMLAYPDIVGLLYRLCRNCEQSLIEKRKEKGRVG